MPCSKTKKLTSMMQELKRQGLSDANALKIATAVSGKIKDTDEYSSALADRIGIAFAIDDTAGENPLGNDGNKTTGESGDVVKNNDGTYTDGTITSNKSQSEFIDKFVEFAKPENRRAGAAFSLSGLGGTGKTTSVSLAVRAAGFNDEMVVYSTHQNNAANILSEAVGKKALTNYKTLELTMKRVYENGESYQTAVRKQFRGRDGNYYDTTTIMNHLRDINSNNDTGLLIVDESSVLDENMIRKMIEEAEKFNFMILFMGDHHQLPPVITDGRKDSKAESPLYAGMKSVYGKNHHTLTEKVRTNQNSDIAKVSDIVVEQIDTDIFKAPNISGIDKGDGSVTYEPNVDAGLEMFVKAYKADPTNTRLITMNKPEHKMMTKLANELRTKLYGKENITFKTKDGKTLNKYSKGELVIIEQNSAAADGSTVATSETMYVLDDEPSHDSTVERMTWYNKGIKNIDFVEFEAYYQDTIQEKHIEIIDGEMYLNLEHVVKARGLFSLYSEVDKATVFEEIKDKTERENMIKLMEVSNKLYNDISDENISEDEANEIRRNIARDFRGKFKTKKAIRIILENSVGIASAMLPVLAGEDSVKISLPQGTDDKGRYSILSFIKNELVNTVSSAVLINSHKAQGATYKNVFVHMDNFNYNAKMSFNSNPDKRGLGLPIINKGLYVALSRASKKLTLIGNAQVFGINNKTTSIPVRPFSYGFTVTPKAKPDMVKAVAKAKKASQYIGFGKQGSSTRLYADQAYQQGVPVNSGSYSDKDIIFVSVNGTPSKEDFKSTLSYSVAALEANAILLLDSSEYLKNSSYNKGEQELAKALTKRGYEYKDAKSNNYAAWRKKQTNEEDGTVNVFYGTNENAILSNFAIRPFIDEIISNGVEFQSVEQAFQVSKTYFSSDADAEKIRAKMMNEKNGEKLKSLGRTVKMKIEEIADFDDKKDDYMYSFIKQSFDQNEDARKALLETVGKVITHSQDRGYWGKKFPELLMKYRDSIANNNNGNEPEDDNGNEPEDNNGNEPEDNNALVVNKYFDEGKVNNGGDDDFKELDELLSGFFSAMIDEANKNTEKILNTKNNKKTKNTDDDKTKNTDDDKTKNTDDDDKTNEYDDYTIDEINDDLGVYLSDDGETWIINKYASFGPMLYDRIYGTPLGRIVMRKSFWSSSFTTDYVVPPDIQHIRSSKKLSEAYNLMKLNKNASDKFNENKVEIAIKEVAKVLSNNYETSLALAKTKGKDLFVSSDDPDLSYLLTVAYNAYRDTLPDIIEEEEVNTNADTNGQDPFIESDDFKKIKKLASTKTPKKADAKLAREVGEKLGIDIGRMNPKSKELIVELAQIISGNNTKQFVADNQDTLTTISAAASILSQPKDSSLRAVKIELKQSSKDLLSDRAVDLIEDAIAESDKAKAKIVSDDIELGSDAKMSFGKATETVELKSADDFDAFLTETLNLDDEANNYMEEQDDGNIVPSNAYRNHLQKLKDILVDGMQRLYDDININVEKRLEKKANSHTQGSFSYDPNQAINENKSTIKLLESGSSEISSLSEVTMHESIHALIKGYLGKDRKMRNRVKSIHKLFLHAIVQEEHDYTMFLDQIKGREPTAYEIQTAKDKFGYVFSETTNPEEFLAYALTNKALFELVQDVDMDYAKELQEAVDEKEFQEKQRKRIESGKLLSKAAALLAELMRGINLKLKMFIESDNATDELMDVMSAIIDRKEAIKNNYNGSLWTRMLGRIGKFIPDNYIGKPIFFSASVFGRVIKWFNGQIGNLLSSRAVQMIKIRVAHIYDSIAGSSPIKLVKSFRNLALIRKIMHSDTFVSLQHRMFRSQYLSESKELFNYAKQKNKIDSFVIALKVQLEKTVKSKFGNQAEKSSSEILTVHKSGLSRLALSSDFSDITRTTAGMDKNHYLNEVISMLSKKGVSEEKQEMVIRQLDALAKYNANRTVSGDLIELSMQNILAFKPTSNYMDKILTTDNDLMLAVEGYTSISTALNLDDVRFEQLKAVSGSEEKKKMVRVLLSKERMYRRTILDGRNGRTNIPDVIDIENDFNSGKTVRFGTKKDATAIGSTMIDDGPIITLSDGTGIYRYATINYAPSVRDSVYETTTSTVDGVELKDIVARAMMKKNKRHDDKFKAKLTEELAALEEKYPDLILSHKGINHYGTLYIPHGNAVKNVVGAHRKSFSDELVDRISSLGREELVSDYNRRLLKKIHKIAIKKSSIPIGREDSYVSLDTVMSDQPNASKVYVERHIALLLSGSTRASLTNASIFGYKPLNGHQGMKNILGLIEAILSEIASKTKEMIVLVNPAVVIGNIVSNLFSAMSMGISPVQFTKKYVDRWRNFNEISELLIRRADTLTNPDLTKKQAMDEIARIDVLLEANADYKLYKSGHISTSAESVDTDITHANQSIARTLYEGFKITPKLYTKKEYEKDLAKTIEVIRLEGKITNQTDMMFEAKRRLRKNTVKNMKMFSFVKDVVREVIVTDKSAIKEVANKNLVYSDSIAKSIVLEHRIESGQSKSMEDEFALLDDVFVNYDYAQGPLEQYFESIGQFLFMKYYSSSMKAAAIKAYTHKQGNVGFYGSEIALGTNIVSPDDSFMKSSMYDAIANRNQMKDVFSNATIPIQAHIDDIFSISGVYSAMFGSKMSWI